MDNQYDPLYDLLQVCDSAIQLIINDHRTSYLPVKDYLDSNSMFSVIPQAMREKMIEADRTVTLIFVPLRDNGATVRMYGACVYEVLMRACYHVRQARRMLALPHHAGAVNSTSLLKELGDTCKGEVILTINPFKGHWHIEAKGGKVWDATAKDYFADLESYEPDKFQPDRDGDYEISPAERQAMEELNQTLHIQFYPNTPVGFYDWYDTDLGDMLERAVGQAKVSVGATVERLVELMAESKLT